MTSAKPETLEECWSLIEMMDREVVGAQEDLARVKIELRMYQQLAEGYENQIEKAVRVLEGSEDE